MSKEKSFRVLHLLSYLFSLLTLLYLGTYTFLYRPLDTRYSIFQTIPILDRANVYPGYTLISPYNRLLSLNPDWQGKVYLLDLFGRPVHTWHTNQQALYSVLEKNGNLLAVMEQPKYSEFLPPGGNTGTVEELDWQSRVVWQYKNERMHHDIVQLPSGNVVVSLWEKTPAAIASQVRGGVAGTELNGTMWSDELAEINRQGKIVWSWHSSEHLDPTIDILDASMPRYAWTYTNGFKYVKHNPVDGTEAFLVSMRVLDEVMLVRKQDGKIIWRSPKGMLNTQHDPTMLANGDVLVFDNGFARPPDPFPSFGTRAVEINPRTDKVVWQFDGGPGAIDKMNFFSPIVGGAQRLPNGNTLITDGPRGHIFEVTPQKKVVWDMVNPYTTPMTGAFPNHFLFKVRQYGADEIRWPEKLPPPVSGFAYASYELLKNIYPF